MKDEALRAAVEIFAELPDPRVNRGLNHALVNIVTIALCAVLSEAESFADIQAFGEEKRSWLEGSGLADRRSHPDAGDATAGAQRHPAQRGHIL